jgi:hypothetical protein
MKGLVHFKDGHTEEIVKHERVDGDIYFETASNSYSRVRLPDDMGYIFNKITSNNHIIPIAKIKWIDIFD